jgi:hypothetical protein
VGFSSAHNINKFISPHEYEARKTYRISNTQRFTLSAFSEKYKLILSAAELAV